MKSMMRRRMGGHSRMPGCGNTAYCSLVPSGSSYTGKLYRINLADGSLSILRNLTSHYFTSMENMNGTFYAFCNDFTKGFGTVDITTGIYTKIYNITKGMTDMSYDNVGGVLYGLRYGVIWSLDVTVENPVQVYTGDLRFIAIAAQGGDMYAVTSSATGPVSLYRFQGCDFSRQPELITTFALCTKYTQSMAFVPGTRILYWLHSNAGIHHLVCIDLTDLSNPLHLGSVQLANTLCGLVILEG